VPASFAAADAAALGQVADTPARILELARFYGEDLVIIAIGNDSQSERERERNVLP